MLQALIVIAVVCGALLALAFALNLVVSGFLIKQVLHFIKDVDKEIASEHKVGGKG